MHSELDAGARVGCQEGTGVGPSQNNFPTRHRWKRSADNRAIEGNGHRKAPLMFLVAAFVEGLRRIVPESIVNQPVDDANLAGAGRPDELASEVTPAYTSPLWEVGR